MLTQVRAHALLDGVRGQPPMDKAAIVDTLLRISQLVQDFPEIIRNGYQSPDGVPPGRRCFGIGYAAGFKIIT